MLKLRKMAKRSRKCCLVCLLSLFTSLFLLCGFYTELLTDQMKTTLLYARYFITGEKVGHVYVFSAVAQLGISKTGYTKIILNVWDNSFNKKFYCCIQFDNEHIVVRAYRTTVFHYDTLVVAGQYECDISSHMTLPGRVGITESRFCLFTNTKIQQSQGNFCESNQTYYTIHYPKKNEGKLGVCPKIAYDKIHPVKLIEWFEYQKMMGVDKVIIAMQNINHEALRVLEYYNKQGLVELIPYPMQIPGDVYGFRNRGFEVGRRVFPQFSHDEQVSVYHCFSRLQSFEYAAIMDFDEYLVSSENQTTLQLLGKLRDIYPDAAAFTFYTSFYLTDKSEFYKDVLTSSYLKKVGPRMECQKNVYIPSRTSMASTHVVDPSSKYKVKIVPPKIAELNHYRQCPGQKYWKNNCSNVHEAMDTTMLRYHKELSIRIKAQRHIIEGR